LARAKVAQIL
jgi:hypothetical protein